jgi:translation initiation factor IF-2
VSSLRRFQEDVREVQTGLECGVGAEGFSDFQEGDVIEAFHTETEA